MKTPARARRTPSQGPGRSTRTPRSRPPRANAAEPAEAGAAGRGSAATGGAEEPEAAVEGGEDTPPVGENLRRIRLARGLSLDTLAEVSGVSRAMLSQVELGRSAPTIKVLWKIARALELPFSALLSSGREERTVLIQPASRARRLTSHDGRFSTRALYSPDRPRRVEFYELRLAPGALEHAEAHAPGTQENLVVGRGAIEVSAGGEVWKLGTGDAMQFVADVPHTYRNSSPRDAWVYLVMTYTDGVHD